MRPTSTKAERDRCWWGARAANANGRSDPMVTSGGGGPASGACTIHTETSPRGHRGLVPAGVATTNGGRRRPRGPLRLLTGVACGGQDRAGDRRATRLAVRPLGSTAKCAHENRAPRQGFYRDNQVWPARKLSRRAGSLAT